MRQSTAMGDWALTVMAARTRANVVNNLILFMSYILFCLNMLFNRLSQASSSRSSTSSKPSLPS